MDAPQIAGDKSGGRMITLTREEAQQVLDALEDAADHIGCPDDDDAIGVARRTLRTRLAQPEPEPVAWYWSRGVEFTIAFEEMDGHAPLYLHPPQREWHGLTETEKEMLWDEAVEGREHFCSQYGDFADAIEAKLKEKNT
jgi:hypothetical protein